VPVIAERSGEYRLEVRHAATATLEPGEKYAVRLAALRPATPRDSERVAAERLFAATAYRQALSAFRALGERGREAAALYSLAQTRSDPEGAKEALALFRGLGWQHEAGCTLNLLGLLYSYQGKYRQAMGPYTDALALSRSLGERSSEAMILHNLGTAHRMLGETGEAIASFR